MRQLTQREQLQTTFKWVEVKGRNWGNALYTGRNPDPNESCPYCKNDFPDVIRDKAYLASYEVNPFFQGKKYKVMSCYCCNAIFSWYKEKESEQ